jgi:hypothetical protein
MPTNPLVLTVLISCLLLLASCGHDNGGPLSREQAIDIAAHHLIGKSFDTVPPTTVSFANGNYTVSFERQVPEGVPGETYITKVVFDAKTREALEIEMDTKKSGAAPDQADSGRPTPLMEEVDQVEAIRKQPVKH